MKKLITISFLFFIIVSFAQSKNKDIKKSKKNFKFIEFKSHFGSFLKSNNTLSNSGIIDNGYGGITIKVGWQPTDSNGWASRYGYPSYGVGFYSGFLSDAEVFGNPNAFYGFVRFPISSSNRRHVFAIQPSLGLTYKLNPYNSETNPINEAIGARMAVYFNLDFGFSYKWTRELDLLYGIDFSHFSNGSTYKPNNGLNLYGINLGLRYNYNTKQLRDTESIYKRDTLQARFKRPIRSNTLLIKKHGITAYIAGGISQADAHIDTNKLLGNFTGVIDYEYQFNEKGAITAGIDFFYDNRFQERKASDRWLTGMHVGYDFRMYKFAVKMQVGTYLGNDKGKGVFFMRPALRYHITKNFFSQVGLKTLDGGAADYIEYGIGYNLF